MIRHVMYVFRSLFPCNSDGHQLPRLAFAVATINDHQWWSQLSRLAFTQRKLRRGLCVGIISGSEGVREPCCKKRVSNTFDTNTTLKRKMRIKSNTVSSPHWVGKIYNYEKTAKKWKLGFETVSSSRSNSLVKNINNYHIKKKKRISVWNSFKITLKHTGQMSSC